MRKFVRVATAIAVAGIGSSAQAVSVQVRDALGGDHSSGYPGGFLAGTGSVLHGTTTNGASTAFSVGTYDLEADYGAGFTSLLTYCAEPNQDSLFGPNPPDAVGVPYEIDAVTNGHGFTATEADYLAILWANAFALSQTSHDLAAAFQSIVWEFSEDDSFNLTTGNYRIDSSHIYSAGVLDTAQEWIDNILDETWTSSANLVMLTHPDSQDYLTEVVPAPGAAVIMLGGLMMGRGRRRRI